LIRRIDLVIRNVSQAVGFAEYILEKKENQKVGSNKCSYKNI